MLNVLGELRRGAMSSAVLSVSAAGWYEGMIRVGDAQVPCKLIDYNANGAFNDAALQPDQADRIRLDPAQDAQDLQVGRYLTYQDTLYALEVAQDGAFVTLRKADDVPTGRVRVSSTLTSLTAAGPYGQFVCRPVDGQVTLPVGTYRIAAWSVRRKDDSGSPWEARGSVVDGPKGLIQVTADRPADATDVGEPLICEVDTSHSGGTYTISQHLSGNLGETVNILKDGQRPRAPRLHVRNRDGTFDRTYNFEYG